MHFSTLAASAALFGASAMAGVVTYTSIDLITITSCAAYVTNCPAKTYTSSYHVVSTCDEEISATQAPVYYGHTTASPVAVYAPHTTQAPVYNAPSVVTYTSIDHVTITSCAAYVASCPARTYHSTAYSLSTYCPESPVYTVPVNHTYVAPVPPPVTYTTTLISTICPGVNYCYATTVTSTYCPYSTTPVTYKPYVPVTVSASPYVPVVTTYVAPYVTPYKNVTAPAPVYVNGASSSQVSFGVFAIAALAGLFIAA